MYNRQLNTFLAVAETGSFRKAAERLFISSSAVIQQIDLLERDLQAALFVRTQRGVRLTEAGEYLAEEAPRYIREGEQIRDRLIDLNTRKTTVCVGTSLAEKCRLLYDLWILFTQKGRPYEIRLVGLDGEREPSPTVQLIECVQDGAPWQKGWEFQEICRVPLSCAVAKDHPAADKDRIGLQDMRDSNLIVIDRGDGGLLGTVYRTLEQEGIPYERAPGWNPSMIWEWSLQKKMLLVPACWNDVIFDFHFLPCDIRDTLGYGFFYRSDRGGEDAREMRGVQPDGMERGAPLREFLDFTRRVYDGTEATEMVPVL